MVKHTHILPILPLLRRHAFVLAGCRATADESVMTCLRAYKANPETVRPATARLDAFRLFYSALDHLPPTGRKSKAGFVRADGAVSLVVDNTRESGEASTITRRLDMLPARERRVLALVVVEGFSYAETAQVLGLTTTEVARRLGNGRRMLAQAGEPADHHAQIKEA